MTLSTKSLEERLTPSSKQVPFMDVLTDVQSSSNSVGVQFVRFKLYSVMKCPPDP